jgi:hypothetical protein
MTEYWNINNPIIGPEILHFSVACFNICLTRFMVINYQQSYMVTVAMSSPISGKTHNLFMQVSLINFLSYRAIDCSHVYRIIDYSSNSKIHILAIICIVTVTVCVYVYK